MNIKQLILLFCILFTIPSLAQNSLPFELEADKVKLENKDNELFASGNVIIKYKIYTIVSEEVIYKKKINQLVFDKYFKLTDTKNNSLYGEKLVINLETNNGYVENGSIKTFNNYLIKAERIELTDDKFLLKKCSFTNCTSERPEWYVKTDELSILKKSNIANAKENILYFYQIPIFWVPMYSQSISDSTISNRPSPEFGYNKIDGSYINAYIGYLLSDDISGKAGIGTSENRGFRYGATHTIKAWKNSALIIKTFNVEKTNFEGGISYLWKNNNESSDFQPIINSLYVPTENNKLESFFSADYLFDSNNFNELYHSIPSLELGFENLQFHFATKLSGKIGTGYFIDRLFKSNRNNFKIKLDHQLAKFNEDSSLSQSLIIKNNYYQDNTLSWQRIFSNLSLKIPILNTKHIFSYTKLLYDKGESPFIFDTINEVTDDEISTLSEFYLLPILLQLESNYQINKQSYRNFKYTASYVFQCWQLEVTVDTVWDEISYGISIPNIDYLF